jgi:MtrB/PioB family decaheme-associated outer membrane protein
MRARIVLMIALAASLLAASQAVAQSDGSVTFGGGFWTQDTPEAKFHEYVDLPRGAFLGDYVLREFHGPWAGALWGKAPTRNDQTNSLYAARGVTWRLDASFTAIPHSFSDVAHTPYAQDLKGVFTLSDSVQRQIQNLPQTGTNPAQNAALQELLRNAPHVPLAMQTDVTRVRLRARPVKDWQFDLRGTDRERNGSMAMGATVGGPGGPTVELPSPIDQRIVDLDASGSYMHGPAKVMATVGVSSFKNRVNGITFDHFRVFNTDTTRSAVNRISTAPDNMSVRARVAGSWQLPYSSTFTATVGVSHTTQDQDFLPQTTNTAILAKYAGTDVLSLERSNLEGKVTDIVQDYRLTGRPMPDFFGTLRFREEKSDDKTPLLGLPYGFVNYDQTRSRNAVESEATSSTHSVLGFDGDYSLGPKATVSVLAERRTRELPEWREVTKDAENVFGASLKVRPMDGTEASVGYQVGQRRMDSFDAAAYDGAEWASLRRYDIADRDQSKLDGMISWSAMENLDLSVNGWWTKDDYLNSQYGLNSSENTQAFVEAAWHASKTLDLSGGFGYGEQITDQSSIENPNAGVSDTLSVAPWTANFNDKNNFAYARADWWAKPKQFQVSAEYTFIRDMIVYDFNHVILPSASGIIPANVASTTAIDWPNTFTRSHDIQLTGTWHWSPQFSLGCTYGYVKYEYSDAIYQDIRRLNINPANVASAGSAIFLDDDRFSYKAQWFQVKASRRF